MCSDRIFYLSAVSDGSFWTRDLDAAFYWSCVLAQKRGDKAALLFFAEQLLSLDETGETLKLNGNILIALANEEIACAFSYLGHLHLSNVDGFNSNPFLAVLYFTVAGVELGDDATLETIGMCYIRGIGTDVDVPKGIALMRQAGASQAEIDRELRNHVPAESGSVVIPVLFVAAVVLIGASLLFRRRSTKK
jgi:hypothetical protein